MELKNKEAWDETVKINDDPYGSATVKYAEMWAMLMEEAVARGFTLEEIAKETSSEADTEGITGNMYGAAVRILAECWVHGEQLRIWHNEQYGVSKEKKGTVNPAVITIDASSDEEALGKIKKAAEDAGMTVLNGQEVLDHLGIKKDKEE